MTSEEEARAAVLAEVAPLGKESPQQPHVAEQCRQAWSDHRVPSGDTKARSAGFGPGLRE